MRTVKWNAFLSGLCGFAALGVLAASARADVVTEKGASILAFPKVVVGGLGINDTIIQIANTSNSMVHARCFYTDAQLPEGCDEEAPLLGCTPIWQTTDFAIWLTKQQPTHWVVGDGRPIDPTDDYDIDADGAGFDPGAIPPMSSGFTGELKCVEVTIDGQPIGGNHLIGLATLVYPTGDISKYNAIGIQGTENVGGTGNVLQLNNPRGETSGQYNACPATLLLNHFAEDASDPFFSGAIETTLTVIPCSQDYESSTPGRVTMQFEIFNEFEERFSASTTVTCWKNTRLQDIDSPNTPDNSVFGFDVLGSLAVHTRIKPAEPLNGAVIGIVETARGGTHAAFNIHTEGDRIRDTEFGGFDEIILSDEF